MLEGVVVDHLTWLLGDYVIGLDREKVKVAAWKGSLELHGLELRPEALSILLEGLGMDIPMHVASSYVELLSIEIPWKQLKRKPLVVKLSNIAVVATPQKEQGRAAFERGRMRIKLARLHADDTFRELSWKDKLGLAQDNKKSAQSSRWKNRVTSKLLQRISESLQIEFTSAVIRYEDAFTNPSCPFALQLKVETLRVQPTRADWTPLGTDPSEGSVLYSAASIRGVEARLSPLKKKFGQSLTSVGEVRAHLQALLDGRPGDYDELPNQLLAPSDISLRVTRVSASGIGMAQFEALLSERPAVQVEVLTQSLDVSLNNFQYEQLLQLSNEIVSLVRKERFAFRPTTGKDWWNLALELALPGFRARKEKRDRLKISELRKWRLNLQVYNTARKSMLEARRSGKPVGNEVMDMVEGLERNMTYEDILLYRAVCDREMERSVLAAADASTGSAAASGRLLNFFRTKTQTAKDTDGLKSTYSEGRSSGLGLVQLRNLEAAQEIAEAPPEDEPPPESDGGGRVAPWANLERVAVTVVVKRGSVTLSGGGADVPPVPFLGATVMDLRVGVLRCSEDNSQVQVILGAVESWDLSNQKRMLFPKQAQSDKVTRMRDKLRSSAAERQPDRAWMIDTNMHRKLFEGLPCIGIFHYVQIQADQENAEIGLQSAFAGFDAVVDCSSSCLETLAAFLQPPSAVDEVISALSDVAAARLANLRRRLQAVFFSKQRPMDVDVVVEASTLVVTGSDDRGPSASIGLGDLEISSQSALATIDVDDAPQAAYAKYQLHLGDVQACSYLGSGSGGENQYHRILAPIDLQMEAGFLQYPELVDGLADGEARAKLPKTTLTGSLPKMSIVLDQESYRHMFYLGREWVLGTSGPARETADFSAYADLLNKQLRRRRSLANHAGAGLPALDANFVLPEVELLLTSKGQRLVDVNAQGFAGWLRNGAENLRGTASISDVTVLSSGPRAPLLQNARVLEACADADDSDQESSGAFLELDFESEYIEQTQRATLRSRVLKVQLIREFVAELVQFFSEDLQEPSTSGKGGVNIQAAKMLKRQAKDVVAFSSRLLEDRVSLFSFEAQLDGVNLTMLDTSGRPVAAFDAQQFGVTYGFQNSGRVDLDGQVQGLVLRNMLTGNVEQRDVLTYSNRSYADSWHLAVLPEEEGRLVMSGNFRGLRMMHTFNFMSQLREYFRELRGQLKSVADAHGQLQISELLSDEIETSKKAIPNFKVEFGLHDLMLLVPRNSTSVDEAVLVECGTATVNNHPASEGYNFAFDVGMDALNVSLLYSKNRSLADVKDIWNEAELSRVFPSLARAKLLIKVDWWREMLPVPGAESYVNDEVDPHERLPSFRVRLVTPEDVHLTFCEAQYTTLYCVLAENLGEPTVLKLEELNKSDPQKLPGAEAREPPQQPPFMQLLFEVPRATLRIYEGDEVREYASVFQTEFRKIGGLISNWPDQYVLASMSGVLCSVEDCRGAQSGQRVIARQGQNLSNDALVKVSLRQAHMGKLFVDISGSEMWIRVVPELAVRVSRLSSPFVPYHSESKSVSDSAYQALKITFSLPNFEIWIFAEQSAVDERALVLRGAFNLLSDNATWATERRVEVSLSGLQILSSVEGSREMNSAKSVEGSTKARKTPLLYPVDLSLEIDMLGKQSRMISATADSVLCRIAMEDVSLVLAVAERMARGFNPWQEDVWSAPKTGRLRTKIYVSVAAMRILFTSESNHKYSPVMEAKLTGSKIFAEPPLRAEIKAEPSISFFDESAGSWVPGLEPWQFNATFSAQSPVWSVAVSSDRELPLICTPVTTSGVSRVISTFRRAALEIRQDLALRRADETIDRPSVAAFRVRNQCGENLRVWYSSGDNAALLRDGEEYEAVIPKSQLMVSESIDTDVRTEQLKCAVLVEGFNPTVLSVAEKAIHIVRLERNKEGGLVELVGPLRRRHYPLVWDVTMQDGLPVGTARSLYRLRNRTQMKIEVKASEGAGSDFRVVVEAGGVLDVPIFVTEADLRLRPVSEERAVYGWSENFRMPHLLALSLAENRDGQSARTSANGSGGRSRAQKGLEVPVYGGNHTILQCHDKASSETLSLVLRRLVCDSSENAAAGFNRQLLDVDVCAPLRLLNLLPRQLMVRLVRSPVAHGPSHYSMRPFEGVSVYKFDGAMGELNAAVSFSNVFFGAGGNSHPQTAKYGPDLNLKSVSAEPMGLPMQGSKAGDSAVVVKSEELAVGRTLTFYAPYWIANQSDVDLEFQNSVRSSDYPNKIPETTILRSSPPTMGSDDDFFVFRGPHAWIRRVGVSGSDAHHLDLSRIRSDAVELVVPNASLLLVLNREGDKPDCTTLLRVVNSMWLENRLPHALEWCSASAMDKSGVVTSSSVLSIGPGEVAPIHAEQRRDQCKIMVRLAAEKSSDWFWSHEISVSLNDILPVKVYNPRSGEQFFAYARTKMVAGHICKLIIYGANSHSPPYLIRNKCARRQIAFHQVGWTRQPWLLRPDTAARYSWDFPEAPSKDRFLIVLAADDDGDVNDDQQRTFDMSIDDVRSPWRPDDDVENLYASVHVRGSSKVVTFADDDSEETHNAQGAEMELGAASGETRGSGGSAGSSKFPGHDFLSLRSGDIQVALTDPPAERSSLGFAFQLTLDLPQVGLSVVDSTPTEIVYARLTSVLLMVGTEDETDRLSVHFSVGGLQVDSQLMYGTSCAYLCASEGSTGLEPSLFSKAPDEPTAGLRASPSLGPIDLDAGSGVFAVGPEDGLLTFTIQTSLHSDVSGYTVIEELTVNLMKINVTVDEGTFSLLSDYFHSLFNIDSHPGFDEIVSKARTELSEMLGEDEDFTLTNKVYIKKLFISPVDINLSVSATAAGLLDRTGHSSSHLFVAYRNVLALLGNISNASFNFETLEMEHVFATLGGMQNTVMKFFLDQFQGQTFKLLTSSELLSTPVALLDMIASGAYDLFGDRKGSSGNDRDTGSKAKETKKPHKTRAPGLSRPRRKLSGLRWKKWSPKTFRTSDSASSAHRSPRVMGSGEESALQLQGLTLDVVEAERISGSGRSPAPRSSPVGRPLGSPEPPAASPLASPVGRFLDPLESESSGQWMRPPRVFAGARVVEYDLRRAVGQMLLRAVGSEESLIDWVLLSAQQPDESELRAIWSVMRDFVRPSAPESSGDHEHELAKRVMGIVTASTVVVARVSKRKVWTLPLDSIVSMKKSEEEEDVLLIEVRGERSTKKTYWPAIVCGSAESCALLLDLLESVKSMRNQWQGDTLLGPITRQGLPSVQGPTGDDENPVLQEAIALTQRASLRDPDSHRSVQVIILNALAEKLILSNVELKSGTWRREPPKHVGANTAEFCEADGGKEVTADLHGSVTYKLESTKALVRLTFVNLFLAPNSFYARGPPSVDVAVATHIDADDHVLVSFTVADSLSLAAGADSLRDM